MITPPEDLNIVYTDIVFVLRDDESVDKYVGGIFEKNIPHNPDAPTLEQFLTFLWAEVDKEPPQGGGGWVKFDQEQSESSGIAGIQTLGE